MLRAVPISDEAKDPVVTTADDAPTFTGERFVPGVGGSIELEHLHRYAFAVQACTDKAVLDIACGEGYGSAMLGTVARSVVGVDIALDTVAHATAHYARRNVTFRAGDCAAIPLDDASVDVVVSFETIEHHAHHEEMLREIRRVLRPGGLMILSSPERFEYSERPGTNNPFHVRELYRQEFVDLVARHFPHSDLYHQKILFGSAILAERIATPTTSLHTDEPFDEPASGLPRPVYLIAVASDGALPTLSTGVFEQPLAESSEWAFWIDTVADRDRMIHKLDASATVAEQRAAALGEQLRTAQDERLKVNEQLLDAHDRLIRANEQRLTAQEEIAASREQLIASQRDVATNEGHLSDARREVATTQARLLEAQALIATSHGQLAEAHERQRQHETEFRELQRRCGDSDEGSERDRLALQALEQQLRAANEQVADARQQARQIEHSLHLEQEARRAVYASTSWRITSPLRTAKDLLRAPPRIGRTALRLVLNAIKKVYHGIPVSRDAKHRAKDLFFSTFAFALKRTGSYQAWVRWQNRDLDYVPDVIRQLAANDTLIAEPSAIAPTYSAAGTPLWIADGIREWSQLEPMRQRIAAAARALTDRFEPVAEPMVSIKPAECAAAAAALIVPAVDEPEVTILIPVFNHLPLTLECLTSIRRAATSVSYEILIADDASTDETAAVLAGIPNLRIHRNATNLNFLRNCNAALPSARGRFVVFLNNDVQVRDRWLDEMVDVFRTVEGVGAVGPRIVYPSGHLQEAGVSFNADMTADMIGLNDDPQRPQYSYRRKVDFCSGACLMVPRDLLVELGGFDEHFAPAYCEDSDLCLRIHEAGRSVVYAPGATVVHRLSSTTAAIDDAEKYRLVSNNLVKLADRWQAKIERDTSIRSIAFYLPQFHPFAENDRWWGKGFTEWSNVTRAQPNFAGHYQPHLPADLGFYDLRIAQVMEEQANLARRYGLGGFCFYYYWFAGKRLLELPIERMLDSGKPDFPFCLCWANENWTRRWDGQNDQVLMAQSHSEQDDEAVILDLIRFFRSPNYIRIDGRPLLVVYRVTLFPDFARTAALWREVCRREGIGEIYLSMVESFELIHDNFHPSKYGCDASVEFPPQQLADPIEPSGAIVNPDFKGGVGDYRDLVVRYCTREAPAYTRFRGAMPGWDNTPRRQNNSFCFENATPGAFQAWLEYVFEETRRQRSGEERIVFINAWNEWAEGAHLEPDRRFGHTFLEALRNAKDGPALLRMQRYAAFG